MHALYQLLILKIRLDKKYPEGEFWILFSYINIKAESEQGDLICVCQSLKIKK